jgi:HEAT repeat protein
VPELLRLADGCGSWTAFHSAKSLWIICTRQFARHCLDADDIVARIAACLQSHDPQVRVVAVDQLGRTGRFAEPPILQLIECLDDPVVEVACAAAESLARFGAAAVDAVPKLLNWVNDENPAKRFFGSAAVIQIDEVYRAALVPVMLDTFESLDSRLRAKAIYAIGTVSIFASEPVSILIGLVGLYRPTENRDVRLAVVSVLAGYGLDVAEVLPVLVAAVGDEDREIVRAALRGLGVWGRKARAAVPNLLCRLEAELANQGTNDRWENELRVELIEDLRDALVDIGGSATRRR